MCLILKRPHQCLAITSNAYFPKLIQTRPSIPDHISGLFVYLLDMPPFFIISLFRSKSPKYFYKNPFHWPCSPTISFQRVLPNSVFPSRLSVPDFTHCFLSLLLFLNTHYFCKRSLNSSKGSPKVLTLLGGYEMNCDDYRVVTELTHPFPPAVCYSHSSASLSAFPGPFPGSTIPTGLLPVSTRVSSSSTLPPESELGYD